MTTATAQTTRVSTLLRTLNEAASTATPAQLTALRAAAQQHPTHTPRQATEVVQRVMGWR